MRPTSSSSRSRDHQFEIEYLIALSIAVFGIITADNIGEVVFENLGYLLIFIISIHAVLFTIAYSIKNATSFSVSSAEFLYNLSRYTLASTTAIFVIFVFHVPMNILYYSVIEGLSQEITLSPRTLQILISLVVPTFIVVAMGAGFYHFIFTVLHTFRDIRITIVPRETVIYSKFDETEPLLIKIENHGDTRFEADLEVQFPDDVRWKTQREQGTDSKLEKSVSIDSMRQHRLDIQLAYDGDSKKSDTIPIIVDHPKGDYRKEVQVYLTHK